MDHDGSYKRIFSEPRMVQDLLTGFVKQQWVNELDFTTLEQITSEHISDNFDKRFNDTVWKVKFHNSWMYICILLEFQSTPDKWMSLRIMTYLGLLYETLVRNNEILKTGKLPPVIPIVLYNGTPRWRESTQISDLIDYVSEECDFFRPHLSYLLIDEGAIQSDLLTSPEMKDAQNLVASLFALENAVEKHAILAIVAEMVNWLQLPKQQSLSRALAGWFNRVLRPTKNVDDVPMFEDLTEVNTMLRETVQNWYKKAEKEGWTAGIAAGIKEGRKEGRKEGEEHGLEKGIRAAKVEIARAMKKNNESLSKIAAFTGLSEEEIELL